MIFRPRPGGKRPSETGHGRNYYTQDRMIAQIRNPANRLSLAWMLVAATTGGCAQLSDGSSASNRSGSLSTDCIMSRSVRDYETLDDQNLVIYGTGSSAYHVVLTTRSINLGSEYEIGVLDAALGGVTDDRICPYGGDAIIIDGPIVERIRILSIERLDPAALEALKVQFGVEEAADDLVTDTVVQ